MYVYIYILSFWSEEDDGTLQFEMGLLWEFIIDTDSTLFFLLSIASSFESHVSSENSLLSGLGLGGVFDVPTSLIHWSVEYEHGSIVSEGAGRNIPLSNQDVSHGTRCRRIQLCASEPRHGGGDTSLHRSRLGPINSNRLPLWIMLDSVLMSECAIDRQDWLEQSHTSFSLGLSEVVP